MVTYDDVYVSQVQVLTFCILIASWELDSRKLYQTKHKEAIASFEHEIHQLFIKVPFYMLVIQGISHFGTVP